MTLLRSKFIGEFNAEEYMVTPAYNTDAPVNEANALDVAADLAVYWGPILAALAGIQVPPFVWTLLRLSTIDFLDGSETELIEVPLGIPGTQPGDGLPAFCSALLSLPVIGNSRSARMFVPCLGEMNSNGNDWTGPTQGNLATAADLWALIFPGGISGQTFTPGMWSTANLAFYPTGGDGFVDVETSHQVRRKVGRGS